MKAEIDSEQEFRLKRIDFGACNPPHLGVIGIIEILIIKELDSNHNAAREAEIWKGRRDVRLGG